MRVPISVSKYVKKRLEEIKEEKNHTSLDSVIRTLLKLRMKEEIEELSKKVERNSAKLERLSNKIQKVMKKSKKREKPNMKPKSK